MTRTLRRTRRALLSLTVLASWASWASLSALAALPAFRVQDAAQPAPAAAGSAPASADAPDPRQAQRDRILQIARSYAEFEWRGDGRNVLHGPDRDGTYVDTPDVSFDPKGWRVDGGSNHGMPYAWGGFTSIDEFRQGLAQGLPAGQVPTNEHVEASRAALGLDCSGYIARCWDLPIKQSTRSLGALCYPLPDYEALQPGDILNLFDGHVVLFDHWLDAEHVKLSVFEAARLSITASVYTAEKLRHAGFLPMRYKPLDERWVPMKLEQAGFTLPPAPDGSPSVGRFEAESAAAPAAPASVASPLADARPLEWARYRVTGNDALVPEASERVTMVAAVDGPAVELQTDTVLAGLSVSTGTRCEHADVLLDALLDFAGSDEPLTAVTLGDCTITRGSYVLGGRRFSAFRIEAQISATRVIRHQEYPVSLTLDCVLSPQVPVHGVLEANVSRETVWRAEPPEQREVSRTSSTFQLREFGGEVD